MLAFNLGVFFSNLKGADVTFSAKNEHCEVRFTGGVTSLQETTDLTRHLAVTLGNGEVSCRIAFDESDDPEEEAKEEDERVEVRMVHNAGSEEVDLLQTWFKFEQITLKPHVDEPEEEESEGGAENDNGAPNLK